MEINDLPPRKVNMEPENFPFGKGKHHLPNHHVQVHHVPLLILGGGAFPKIGLPQKWMVKRMENPH